MPRSLMPQPSYSPWHQTRRRFKVHTMQTLLRIILVLLIVLIPQTARAQEKETSPAEAAKKNQDQKKAKAKRTFSNEDIPASAKEFANLSARFLPPPDWNTTPTARDAVLFLCPEVKEFKDGCFLQISMGEWPKGFPLAIDGYFERIGQYYQGSEGNVRGEKMEIAGLSALKLTKRYGNSASETTIYLPVLERKVVYYFTFRTPTELSERHKQVFEKLLQTFEMFPR